MPAVMQNTMFLPKQWCDHCSYSFHRDGQAELGWLVSSIPRWCKRNSSLQTVTHRSTNCAQHRVAMSVETNAPPLCQAITLLVWQSVTDSCRIADAQLLMASYCADLHISVVTREFWEHTSCSKLETTIWLEMPAGRCSHSWIWALEAMITLGTWQFNVDIARLMIKNT